MNIINTYDQLRAAVAAHLIPKEQAVAISYHRRSGVSSAQWVVWSPFFYTDPDAHWSDYNCQTFLVRTGMREKAKTKYAAMVWAEQKYGIEEWRANRMREYVPAIVQKHFPIPTRPKETP